MTTTHWQTCCPSTTSVCFRSTISANGSAIARVRDFQWHCLLVLSYGEELNISNFQTLVQKEYFHKREFCFTLKDDIYLRYQTFNDYNEFERELIRRCPFKIDIGGVYNQIVGCLINYSTLFWLFSPFCSLKKPKDSKNWVHGVLQVEERELVFDIDMTDYDDVRFCCSSASICSSCWPLMQFAIRIVDKALEGYDKTWANANLSYDFRELLLCLLKTTLASSIAYGSIRVDEAFIAGWLTRLPES